MSFPMVSMGGGPGRGIYPGDLKITCDIVTDVTAGVVMLDFLTGATSLPGDSTKFSTVIEGEASAAQVGAHAGIFGYLVDDTDGSGTATTAPIIFSGIIENAKVPTATVEGDRLIAGAAGIFAIAVGGAAGVLNGKVIAIALETDAAGLADIWFDGITGFGHVATVT